MTSELYSPAPNGLELTFHTDSAALAEDEFSQACENLSIGCSNSARSGATDIVALSALIGSDKFPVGDCLAWQVALRQSLPPLHRPVTILNNPLTNNNSKTKSNNKIKTKNKIKVVYTEDLTHPIIPDRLLVTISGTGAKNGTT